MKTETPINLNSTLYKKLRAEQNVKLLLKDLRTFPDDPAFMSDDEFMDFDITVTELFERMIELRTLRSL